MLRRDEERCGSWNPEVGIGLENLVGVKLLVLTR
jgi:hypothetical protein